MTRLTFLLALALVGCKSRPEGPPVPAAAPMPFTADELREATPTGTVLAYRVEQTGTTPIVQHIRVARADDDFAVLESWTTDEQGQMVGTPVSTRKRWSEMIEPLLPPGTTVTDASCDVPAGKFECWEYTVALGDRTKHYYFDKAEPGAPVFAVEEEGGRITRQVTLQSKTVPQS